MVATIEDLKKIARPGKPAAQARRDSSCASGPVPNGPDGSCQRQNEYATWPPTIHTLAS